MKDKIKEILLDEANNGYLLDYSDLVESIGRKEAEQYLDDIALQIANLLLQVDKNNLLADEEIKAIFIRHYTEKYGEVAAKQLLDNLPDCNYAKDIAKAQLQADEIRFMERDEANKVAAKRCSQQVFDLR